MAGRGLPGVERLAEERELFVSLIASGVSNSAACRTVGVNRRTGTRWRYGRSIPSAGGGLLHYPPVIMSRTAVVSPRYLSEDERIVIADLHGDGLTSRAIAEQVRRSPSTVSRELARNTGPDGRYRPSQAQRLAAKRRRRPRARRLEADPVLRGFVQECMDVRWSPEQISHALEVEFPDQPAVSWSRRASTRPSTPRTRCCSAPCAPGVGGDAGVRTAHRTPVAAPGLPPR